MQFGESEITQIIFPLVQISSLGPDDSQRPLPASSLLWTCGGNLVPLGAGMQSPPPVPCPSRGLDVPSEWAVWLCPSSAHLTQRLLFPFPLPLVGDMWDCFSLPAHRWCHCNHHDITFQEGKEEQVLLLPPLPKWVSCWKVLGADAEWNCQRPL